jgi:hypothetical protein
VQQCKDAKAEAIKSTIPCILIGASLLSLSSGNVSLLKVSVGLRA